MIRNLKKLPHRNWEIIRDLWIDHLPDIDLSAEFPGPVLWNLPEVVERLGRPTPEIELPYVTGVRESVFREVVLLARKFTYCRKIALESATRGFPTWSLIAGYDACFYGAKAFCYLLGIASLSRDSDLYLDLFVPRKVRGRKEAQYDVLIAYSLGERLTHNALWQLVGRLCRTLTLPADAAVMNRSLRALSFDQVSNLRNNLMYHSGFWLNHEDFDFCDLVQGLSNPQIYYSLLAPADVPIAAERYFSIAARFQEALVYLLGYIARLAPSIAPEVDALQSWQERRT
jgi:hypothetical protein